MASSSPFSARLSPRVSLSAAEKDTLVAMETEHYLKQIAQTKSETAALKNALLEAEQQLKEQSDAIEAARRISEEAEKKEHRILELEENGECPEPRPASSAHCCAHATGANLSRLMWRRLAPRAAWDWLQSL